MRSYVILFLSNLGTAHSHVLRGTPLLHRLLDQSDNTQVNVIIGLNDDDNIDDYSFLGHPVNRLPGLTKLNAVRASITYTQWNELVTDAAVAYIEEDAVVYADSTYTNYNQYGLEMIQGMNSFNTGPPNNRSACNDPASFKIGIVDSGLDVRHPAIMCRNFNQSDSNCIGKSFDMPDTELWYAPSSVHGTHVAGIIAAVHSSLSVMNGVLSDEDNVCLIIAQVFDSTGQAMSSTIVDAVQWVVDRGADVINLSLSTPVNLQTAEKMYENVVGNGTLVVAASGNGGNSDYGYPASHPSVVSVAAVDEYGDHATFSQSNSEVDISAPGVSILSTVPQGLDAFAQLYLNDRRLYGSFIEGSSAPGSPGIAAHLFVCPQLGKIPCEGPGGHICLIERGDITFDEKALNCENGGGVAVIIYNYSPGVLTGELTDPTNVVIPVIGLSKEDGEMLVNQYSGATMFITRTAGYAYYSGTSMAAPFVAGAASEIWRVCGDSCSNDDVRRCLLTTALDKGDSGPDNYYGAGIVQMQDAFQCLVDTVQCCESASSSGRFPAPTPAPLNMPVLQPVYNYELPGLY